VTLTASSRVRAAIAVIALSSATACAHARPSAGPRTNHKHERALAAELARIFDAPEMQHALWGVEVRSLDRKVTLFSRDAQTLMMPASNMKILTLAAAAETLGWDYRFRTTLQTSAEIEDGVLKGDLIVVGGGDPTINSRQNRGEAVFDADEGNFAAHAMIAVGYDDAKNAFRIQNSWGRNWGDGGYAWFTYDFWKRSTQVAFVID